MRFRGEQVASAGILVGLAAVFAVIGTVQTQTREDELAAAAFLGAHAEVLAAGDGRDAALEDHELAVRAAIAARESGMSLLAVADASLLADAATRDELAETIAALEEEAGLELGEDGSLAPPETPPATRVPDVVMPEGRDAQRAAVDDVHALAAPLLAEGSRLADAAASISRASAQVADAGLAVAASAHEKGATTPAPERASDAAKAAYASAVEALASPARSADLATLVAAYRDAWSAAVASHEEASRVQDEESIQPTYINGILVVNKTYRLPSWYGDGLTAETQAAFNAMQAEAAAYGLGLYISSGFRSYATQESIYNSYVAAQGQAAADRHSARPGHSEHQSGLTFDLNSITEEFAYTPEGAYVRDNAHRFGFVIRYPPGKEAITGYIWEPWHLRYLGVDLATTLYTSGLTLEEYLGITSRY